jgi:hypothetical protein
VQELPARRGRGTKGLLPGVLISTALAGTMNRGLNFQLFLDFEFLWFEDEAVVARSASWVVAGNAADPIIKASK